MLIRNEWSFWEPQHFHKILHVSKMFIKIMFQKAFDYGKLLNFFHIFRFWVHKFGSYNFSEIFDFTEIFTISLIFSIFLILYKVFPIFLRVFQFFKNFSSFLIFCEISDFPLEEVFFWFTRRVFIILDQHLSPSSIKNMTDTKLKTHPVQTYFVVLFYY